MIKSICSILCFFCIVSFSFGNSKPIGLAVSFKEDSKKAYDIKQIIHLPFKKLNNPNQLNFGFTKSDYWLKFNFKKLTPFARYKIVVNTVVNDSIIVFSENNRTFDQKIIGEAFPSAGRFPSYSFVSQKENCTLYFKIIGRDHPMIFPFKIERKETIEKSDLNTLLLLGIVYGVVVLILVLNLVLYFSTFEKIYVYSTLFNLFSLLVLLYFDGMIRLFVFPNSLYWNNQTIAIAFCGSFIFTNYYISELLHLKSHKKEFITYFLAINAAFFLILVLSFWHPLGFNWYLKINLILTTVEVIVFTYCIIYIRKKEKDFFWIQLACVLCLIVFGTITQFHFMGYLPNVFITNYSVHFVILPQILIQAIALGKRSSLLAKQKVSLSQSLQESAQVYSQSLINTIEEERRRISKEFHDSIGQNVLVIRNSMLRMRKEDLQTKHKEKLNELVHITADTLEEIRMISQNLRPTTLDSIGLTASIKSMIDKLNGVVELVFVLDCLDSIDDLIQKDLEINLYRILQELTNNIIKHSKASKAIISIYKEPSKLIISAKDNGIGFDLYKKGDSSPKNGLSAIKERTNILKGELKIETAINQGTTTTVTIPI